MADIFLFRSIFHSILPKPDLAIYHITTNRVYSLQELTLSGRFHLTSEKSHSILRQFQCQMIFRRTFSEDVVLGYWSACRDGGIFLFCAKMWCQFHFWSWKSIFGDGIGDGIFNRCDAGLNCILTPLCNWFWRLFRNITIFGIVDRLGGELICVIRQFTIFLLQAVVTQLWLTVTVLYQPP